jgi:chloramphenicol O-acetyltransferase type A
MIERESYPIANFSCMPWMDFDSLTTCISHPHQTQPLVNWGKIRDDGKMSVAITCNHIFVSGKELSQFYDKSQEYFNHPEL